jgi:hypothetical protein
MDSCNKIVKNEKSGQVDMNSCNKIVTKFLHISFSSSTKIMAFVTIVRKKFLFWLQKSKSQHVKFRILPKAPDPVMQ